MTDQNSSKQQLIRANPIGDGFNGLCTSFQSLCDRNHVQRSPEAIDLLNQEDIRNLSLPFLSMLQSLSISALLPSKIGSKTLRSDILKLISAVASDDFNFDRITPLLKAALATTPDDASIWDLASSAAVESTPPPRESASSIQQTPWSQNTSGIINSSEFRQDVDKVLKSELGPLYVGLQDFRKSFFGNVPGLETSSEAVFCKCVEDGTPLFGAEGWLGWPAGAKEDDVLTWFGDLLSKLEAFASGYSSTPANQRKLLAQPKTPLRGSTGKRSMDIGFVDSVPSYKPEKNARYRWSQILVAGELKSNASADKPSLAWIDLATYAREVLAAQDTRRFVLGFTLCGSYMRLWEFDRLGGIASERFDINKKEGGQLLVTAMLGFLWINDEGLGFDPTIITSGGERYIDIERDGQTERLIIDEVMTRARCIAGRATTCWKAHCKRDPQKPLVIKDSWQYTDREHEGQLIREATEKGVINVARYYHHENVRIRGIDDDVRNNVRRGLDITRATNYRLEGSTLAPNASESLVSRQGRSSHAGVKRVSSATNIVLPPSKRSCSASPMKASMDVLPNRIHRRVVLLDYGKPIFKASSRATLLAAFESCIEGHERLYKAGLLHRDISINNLMINEDDANPSQGAFLIDLDLCVREKREEVSGARGKTGTRAFMAIGALLGQKHSFMHDLESFFWVLFWICVHYNGPGKDIGPTSFQSWNYESEEKLVGSKKGLISDEEDFLASAADVFTPYYRPLISLVNRLRRKVFPNGERWKVADPDLYSVMKLVLREARGIEEQGS